ncbi:lymphokine-activated killer T-cell-originated protein kinase, partial [Corapipo altera]|uniref:lymphokine-activated killer T-cell-originated protein kinase n=1 Tax=Corapipo altera TaxID=415028 RepID=UPI000FD6625D
YLHNEKKLLHGDIKSPNVVVRGDFEAVKICDVGVSLPLDENMTVSDPRLCYVGTEPWKPKEALEEGGIITDRADIFAFGLTLWEMLTLSIPHLTLDSGDEGWEPPRSRRESSLGVPAEPALGQPFPCGNYSQLSLPWDSPFHVGIVPSIPAEPALGQPFPCGNCSRLSLPWDSPFHVGIIPRTKLSLPWDSPFHLGIVPNIPAEPALGQPFPCGNYSRLSLPWDSPFHVGIVPSIPAEPALGQPFPCGNCSQLSLPWHSPFHLGIVPNIPAEPALGQPFPSGNYSQLSLPWDSPFHVGIVPRYRALTEAPDGSLCLAMEFGGEKSLNDLIEERREKGLGPFPATTIFQVALSMARGLK